MCDCELPEFFSRELVRSRKSRECFECGAEMPVGEPYHRFAGRWGGRFQTYATCTQCEELRERLAKESECCVAFGFIGETVQELRRDMQWGREGRAFWRRMRRNEQTAPRVQKCE